MTQFRTTEVYVSGAICGDLWMSSALAGKLVRKDARGHWGFYAKGDTFREALLSMLMHEGGDFQNAQFTEDTEFTVVRVAHDGPGKRSIHYRTKQISALPDCADLVRSETYVSDFIGDCK